MSFSSLGFGILLAVVIAAGGAALAVLSESVALGLVICGISLLFIYEANDDAAPQSYSAMLERLDNLFRSLRG